MLNHVTNLQIQTTFITEIALNDNFACLAFNSNSERNTRMAFATTSDHCTSNDVTSAAICEKL